MLLTCRYATIIPSQLLAVWIWFYSWGLIQGAEAPGPIPCIGPKCWVCIIAVGEYDGASGDGDGFTPLIPTAANDATLLYDTFRAAGVPPSHIMRIDDSQPESMQPVEGERVQRAIDAFLDNKEIQNDHTVIVIFSGHGFADKHQHRARLCLRRARKSRSDVANTLYVPTLYEHLERTPGALKILVCDACRSDSKGSDDDREMVDYLDRDRPQSVALFMSCGHGGLARWSDRLIVEDQSRRASRTSHSVYLYFLALSIKNGIGDDNHDGLVSLSELTSAVERQTQGWVHKYIGDTVEQRPVHIISGSGDPIVVRVPITVQTWTNSVGMTFYRIPAGEYWRGSRPGVGFPNEWPRRRIRLTKDMWIQTTEVTQGQYLRVMKHNPSAFQPNGRTGHRLHNAVDWKSLPVESVSPSDCDRFCAELAVVDHRRPGFYRCPTEAEYEAIGSLMQLNEGPIDSVAWYQDNSGNVTHPVESAPRELIVKGLLGNVREICLDPFNSMFFQMAESEMDPIAPVEVGVEMYRVVKGGSYNSARKVCRLADRSYCSVDDRLNDVGFRVVAEGR